MPHAEPALNPVAGPILKWVGGKSQLLPVLDANYPRALAEGKIETYIEPFVGGGAVFFDIASRFDIGRAFLFDVNPELVILYNAVKHDVDGVMRALDRLAAKYLAANAAGRKNIFYEARDAYNAEMNIAHRAEPGSLRHAQRAALTIFLNRTCFNGLFRVNGKGHFNVPAGDYKNPTILFPGKLIAASRALQNAEIALSDFSACADVVKGNTFIYYDPPYRPVSKTAQFTSYSKDGFGDAEQIRLAEMYRRLDRKSTLQLLSNSDPTNYIDDPFFDELYKGFKILRVDANRRINSDASKRGVLREILVRNY